MNHQCGAKESLVVGNSSPASAKSLRWVSATAAIFAAVFVPLNAYYGNVQDLSVVRPWMLVSVSVILFLALYGFLVGMFWMARKMPRVQAMLITLVAGLVFAAYAQGNLIGLNYGLLDGREIPWNEMVGVGILNSVAWLGIIGAMVGLSIMYARRFFDVLRGVMMAFSCYLVLITVIRGLTCGTVGRHYPAGFSERGFDELSREDNVIVIVLDSLDRHLMDRLLEQRPEWRSKLADFTYYRNTIGMFPFTHFALPQIITGVPDENRESYDEYKDRAYNTSPVLRAAEANGFEVGIYVNSEFSPSAESMLKVPCIQNGVFRRPGVVDAMNYWISSYNAAVFSYLPHFVKKMYRRLMIPCLCANDGEYDTELRCERVEAKFNNCIAEKRFHFAPGKRFKFYHCYGTHLPHYDLAKLEGCLRNLCAFVALLKERKVYDRCKLVVLADHGQENRATPTLLCNNAKGAFEISDTPFTYEDLPVMLESAMKSKVRFWQVPKSSGLRTFLYSKKYDARGRQVLDSSMAKSIYEGRDLTLLNVESFDLQNDREKFWMWSIGTHSRIEIPLKAEFQGRDISVDLSIMLALLGAKHPQMHVTISTEGHVLLEKTIKHEHRSNFSLCFFVPKTLSNRGALALDILIDNTTTPHHLDPKSGDLRHLGLAVESLAVKLVDSVAREFSFDEQSQACLLADGFSHPEKGNGCWSESTSARLYLVIGDVEKTVQRICVNLRFVPFIIGEKLVRQRVTIRCCGQEVFYRSFDTGQECVASFTVPVQCVRDGRLELQMQLPDANSPKEVGYNSDPRRLAVCMRSCRIELAK